MLIVKTVHGMSASCVLDCWTYSSDPVMLLFVCCLTSQQHASVSQGRICSDSFTCCHTEIEIADQIFHLTQSQYIDTGSTSPSTDSITPGSWQGSHWSTNFKSLYDSTPKKSRRKRDSNPGSSALEADVLTTRPARRSDPVHRTTEQVAWTYVRIYIRKWLIASCGNYILSRYLSKQSKPVCMFCSSAFSSFSLRVFF